MVRTEGRTGWGWAQSNNGELRNFSYRNNLLVYRGATGDLLALESGGCDPIDFTHNAWFPDGAVWWSSSGASYGTMSEAIAGAGQPPTTPVFVSRLGRRLSARQLRHLFAVWQERAGFERCQYYNLTAGIVALHVGFKL